MEEEKEKESESHPDPYNPDLTINKPPRHSTYEEIENLINENEELEKLKTKNEYDRIRQEEEEKMGILFLEIDNSLDIIKCKEAFEYGSNFGEVCLSFCHKYSIWKFDHNIFRDVEKMYTMYELIAKKIIGNHEEFKVHLPDKELSKQKSVQFKFEQFNFIENYSYIYGKEGIDLKHFIGDV